MSGTSSEARSLDVASESAPSRAGATRAFGKRYRVQQGVFVGDLTIDLDGCVMVTVVRVA